MRPGLERAIEIFGAGVPGRAGPARLARPPCLALGLLGSCLFGRFGDLSRGEEAQGGKDSERGRDSEGGVS